MRKRAGRLPLPEDVPVRIAGLSRTALDQLFSATYEELRRLAAAVKSGDRHATLNPTTLVHEAWLKLARSPPFAATSELHFKRIAARAMRQLLVESARRRLARKRGADSRPATIPKAFDDLRALEAPQNEDILRIDAALDELARLSPRQAMVVESRFFGGLEVSETAELLQVSEITVLRDWRAVKAWLARELSAGG
jgi:RNA polymerase sigma factor (TIGR02999 family)